MNSVLISHFLTMQDMSINAVINEVLIFVIGVGMGIIANMHLHKNVDYIEKLKDATDEHIKKILEQMSEKVMKNDDSDYNSELFFELREHIRMAKNVAEENYKKQLRRPYLFRFRDSKC